MFMFSKITGEHLSKFSFVDVYDRLYGFKNLISVQIYADQLPQMKILNIIILIDVFP